MSFHEKSNLAMMVVTGLVCANYFWRVLPPAFAGEAASLNDITRLMVGTVVVLIVLSIVTHIVLAILAPSESDAEDERDTMIRRASEARAYIVLTVACLGALGAALMDYSAFWIAQIILAGLVLSDIFAGLMRAYAYRFGA